MSESYAHQQNQSSNYIKLHHLEFVNKAHPLELAKVKPGAGESASEMRDQTITLPPFFFLPCGFIKICDSARSVALAGY